MSMRAYEPWLMLRDLSSGLEQALQAKRREEANPTRSWSPAVDIYETETGYQLAVDLPGVDPKSIEVSMEKETLVVSGERARPEESSEKTLYHRRERVWGAFKRSFKLPEDASTEEITATSENGVLHIRVNKRAEQQPRRIEISH